MSATEVRERAYAKLNLVLHVGRPRPDGLHPICSIFASLDLYDDVRIGPSDTGEDAVHCPAVDAPNLAAAALAALREPIPGLHPLAIEIDKRIPVAAGLGGGSADAAAVLRGANHIAGDPLDPAALRQVAARIGADVPSQVEPRHALVSGVGELIEPLALPPLAAVLVPHDEGLSTAAVYAQLDRMRGWRDRLDPDAVRAIARAEPSTWAAALENDLQLAALALRPGLGETLERLRAAGALSVLVSGSGPTCFGLFEREADARAAAAAIPGAVLARLRDT